MITGEELAAYAAGEADPALVARIDSALPVDEDLSARLASIREVDRQLAAWTTPELGPEAAARLAAGVDVELAHLAGDGPTTTADHVADPTTVPGPLATPGGATAAGATPTTSGWLDRAGRWWRDLAGDVASPVGVLAGAVAAVALVVGGGIVVAGGLGADDGADTTAVMDAAAGPTGPGGGADDRAGSASSGTEAAEADDAAGGSEEMAQEPPSAGLAPPEGVKSGRSRLAIVDDGRVVAAVADIDPAMLRDRLGPLAALTDDGTESAADSPATDDTQSSVPATGEASPLVDGRVGPGDRRVVGACRPDTDDQPIVAEVAILAPGREVILYVYQDRVVVVDALDCLEIAVRRG